jgi:hypothetical protein
LAAKNIDDLNSSRRRQKIRKDKKEEIQKEIKETNTYGMKEIMKKKIKRRVTIRICQLV